MSAANEFRRVFTYYNLHKTFYESIRYNSAVGVDKINIKSFEKNLDKNINIIIRKVQAGCYSFSQYREKLFSKGANKYPRVISIPTIRDKLVLKALYQILSTIYLYQTPFLHSIISDVNNTVSLNSYDSIIRLDIKNFYPSIDHDYLFTIISKKIRKHEIIHLLQNALSQQTVASGSGKDKSINHSGLPQGLSISNILANIYMQQIDQKYLEIKYIKYFRFVDDILIFCSSEDLDQISENIINDLQNINLEVHPKCVPEKHYIGRIDEDFTYLGYKFSNSRISIKKNNYQKMMESLIQILVSYIYSRSPKTNLLLWKINLRITGCQFNGTKYGWLFYYSQINDIKLLGRLDDFVKKIICRYNATFLLPDIKTFCRTYYEIKYNLNHTKYIPNFDKYSIQEKRNTLQEIFNEESNKMTEKQIEYKFKQIIFSNIRKLQRDLSDNS